MKKLYNTPKLDIELLNSLDIMAASDEEDLQVSGENKVKSFNSIMNWS